MNIYESIGIAWVIFCTLAMSVLTLLLAFHGLQRIVSIYRAHVLAPIREGQVYERS